MTKIEINRPGDSSTIELKKLVNFTHSIFTKKGGSLVGTVCRAGW